MPRSDQLVDALFRAIRAFQPNVIIESGTFLGTGSTRVVLEALGDIRPRAFYTIEVSRSLVQQARTNLESTPWVHVVWGLSLNRHEAISFIESDPMLRELDPELDIFVDFLPDPRAGYLHEVQCGIGGGEAGETPDGILVPLLNRHGDDRPLIILDSAGGLGWLEFRIVRETMGNRPYLLFLDDTNHVKHYRSKLAIESSADFVVCDSDFEEGWIIAEHLSASAPRHPVDLKE